MTVSSGANRAVVERLGRHQWTKEQRREVGGRDAAGAVVAGRRGQTDQDRVVAVQQLWEIGWEADPISPPPEAEQWPCGPAVSTLMEAVRMTSHRTRVAGRFGSTI